jgi:hypothetical protein
MPGVDYGALNYLSKAFRLDPQELEKNRYENSILQSSAQDAPLRTEALKNQNAIQGELLQSKARESLAQQFEAIAQSDDPKTLASSLFKSDYFQKAAKAAGVDPNYFVVNPEDTPQTIAQHSSDWARQWGGKVPTKLETIGDVNNPLKTGLYQRNPQTNGIQQITAPKDDAITPYQAEELKLRKQQLDQSGAGGLGGREGVYFNRVISAANESVAGLKNIAELPVGASTGIFGLGASPGTSALGAAASALKNTVAPQVVQDYNTMLAGMSRTLAAIEGAGLAPNGSLTHSMDSIQLRAGDTEVTKLRKLAEMRQIIEKGIEPNLSNPRLPPEQKDFVRSLITQVEDAIPYTQHDITDLQQRQQKNPNITLQQLIAKKGLGASDNIPDGATATGPGGKKIVMRNGKWEPM